MPLPYKPSEYVRPKGTAATHPDDRRAGCPHPAAPCGGANVSILNCQCAAGVNARPTKPETCGGQPGNCGPVLQQTPVGADSISAREPRGTANAPGGYGIRPYGRRQTPGRPGSDIPALQQTSVGDDACIVPHTPRRRKRPGRIWNPPLRMNFVLRAKPGRPPPTRTTVGRDAPSRRTPRHRKRPGRIWNPPLRTTAHPAPPQTPAQRPGPPAAPSPPRPLAQGGFFCRFFTKTPRFICRICAAARPSGKILQPFGAARGFHGRPFMV